MNDPWPAVACLTTGALIFCWWWGATLQKLNDELLKQIRHQSDLLERLVTLTDKLTETEETEE